MDDNLDSHPNPNRNRNRNQDPPGRLFYPSDEQLVCYYLANKNGINIDEGFDVDLIKELNLYSYKPFELPDSVCYPYGYGGKKKHWYCFTRFGNVSRDNRGGRRDAIGGYWLRKGTRQVWGPVGDAAVGTRTKFVFYKGNCYRTAARTDWVMYEYSLVRPQQALFVLCRVFLKPRIEISEMVNGLPSNAEENRFSTCNSSAPSTVDAVQIDISIEEVNDGSGSQWIPPDEKLSTWPICIQGFLFPSGIQEPVSSISGLTGVNILVDAETANQLRCIQEEDFIELDDLID